VIHAFHVEHVQQVVLLALFLKVMESTLLTLVLASIAVLAKADVQQALLQQNNL
jgi:hypothetical protein